MLLAGTAAVGSAALAAGARGPAKVAAAALAGQATFVLAGLRVAGAPRATYRALAHAPALVAQKLSIAAELAMTRGPRDFVRTARETPRP